MMRPIPHLLTAGLLLAATSCRDDVRAPEARDNTAERLEFYKRYNRETRERLDKEERELEEALASGALGEDERTEKARLLEDLKLRLERPDYFEILGEDELPRDLVWESGDDQPDIGSPDAEKGGVQHAYIPGGAYPPTIRSVGAEANSSFRSYHWDDVEMAQVGIHPNTGKLIPGLCDRWAVSEDGRSVYFHIDDDARWSDGREVVADDWMMSFYVYLSGYLSVAFYENYYRDQFWGIASYGKDYFCVRNAYPKPMAPYFASTYPFHVGFYKEFGPDFEKRYNWRPRPTTGAYRIREEDIQKGRSISLTRVKDWWARDRKYYRNRFNVDRIEYRQIRDEEKIFQMFLQGDIDIYLLGDPKKWYERTETEEVFNGFIHKATFYNVYPRPSRGLYFNFSKPPLGNRDVRVGLSHATNWEKVIQTILRGDSQRLHLLNSGFVNISHPTLRARGFSVRKAREAFARAGFTEAGPDGILRNAEGRRLSFTVTYPKHPILDPMLLLIKEEARRAGVEYKLEGLDPTTAFQRTSRKEHEIAFAGWAVTPPFPDFYQQFHSKEAFMPGTRKPRPMTNNLSVYGRAEVDPILEANRNARSFEEVVETSRRLEEIFHEDAVWVPAYKTTFYRLGYWRWVRWPDDFNVKIANEPEVSHVHWIDQERKAETLAAMREGRTFEEVNRVFDRYRDGGETPEPEETGDPGEKGVGDAPVGAPAADGDDGEAGEVDP